MRLAPTMTQAIERAAGKKLRGVRALSGGSVAEVLLLDLGNGARLVAKLGHPGSSLRLEAWMLEYLARESRLPVPSVVHASDELLLLEYIESGDALDGRAERNAAELLAALHNISARQFGLERDTVIGGLPQPNPQSPSWIPFFRDHRLLYMARAAREDGKAGAALLARIEKLAGRLDEYLPEPERPSLIHGDMWGGNVLCRNGAVAGFVDPAIYYADAEIELAFSTLFSTFGDAFFSRYRELRGIRPGFFETRVPLYNLYPLLVHVRLFGGGYVAQVERTLTRFGC
ncbi:MAG TPA: fructosamine kinase family protein [Alphaproteobacteria bacterium]|nr:fructosamine kinase family protein [Alphaproteobacteria bacterium]